MRRTDLPSWSSWKSSMDC